MINKIKQFFSKHTLFIVFLTATSLSICSFLYFYFNDLTLVYNDAISHLNITRRVVDNLAPGFVQLGSVWLPFHHILMLPFIWNDFLWQSGIAGSIVSMFSYIFSSVFLFLLVFRVTKSSLGAWISFLIFALNPNILYLQSTAMSELLLLCLFVLSIYFLIKWFETKDLAPLLISAIFVMLSTLVRYDGWFLLAVEASSILVYLLWKRDNSAIGITILFSSLGGLGVVLWLFYNKVIFSDWFYFLNGEYSASAQQKVFESMGVLDTKYNFLFSSKVYLLDVIFNTGVYLGIFISIAFMIILIIQLFKKKLKIFFVFILIFSPVVFNILTLFLGISILFLPKITAVDSYFNVRYGVMALPAIAFMGGVLIAQWNKRRIRILLFIGLILIMIFQYWFMVSRNEIITLNDGLHGISTTSTDAAREEFLQAIIDNHNNGLILIDAYTNTKIMFESMLSQKKFIHEGAGIYRKESIQTPEKYATLVVVSKSEEDILNRELVKKGKLDNSFDKIFENDKNIIYKIKDKPEIDLLKKLDKK